MHLSVLNVHNLSVHPQSSAPVSSTEAARPYRTPTVQGQTPISVPGSDAAAAQLKPLYRAMHTVLTRSWLQNMMQRSIATDDRTSALADKLSDVQETVAGLKVRHVEQRHHQNCES